MNVIKKHMNVIKKQMSGTSYHWLKEETNSNGLPLFYRENDLPSYVDGEVTFAWLVDRNQHRYNGPSELYHFTPDSDPTRYWTISGVYIDPFEYFEFLDESGIDINSISDYEKVLITMWANANEEL